MSKIEIYRNRDAGPAWCAMGELGDAGYYAGADTRDELLAQIQEAAEMEGSLPKSSRWRAVHLERTRWSFP